MSAVMARPLVSVVSMVAVTVVTALVTGIITEAKHGLTVVIVISEAARMGFNTVVTATSDTEVGMVNMEEACQDSQANTYTAHLVVIPIVAVWERDMDSRLVSTGILVSLVEPQIQWFFSLGYGMSRNW